jgi:hypothetical protein
VLEYSTVNVRIHRLAAIYFSIFASEAHPSFPNLEGVSVTRIICKARLTGWFAVKLGLTAVIIESLEMAMFKDQDKQNEEHLQSQKTCRLCLLINVS